MTIPNRPSPAWPPLRIAQWATIIVLLIASEVVSQLGHTAASWALDTVAVGAFAGFVLVRRTRTANR